MTTRLRIVNHGDVAGYETSVMLVETDADGNETLTDLSARTTAIDVSLEVGKVTKATLHCICAQTEIDAVLEEIVVANLAPWRRRFVWRVERRLWKLGFYPKLRVRVRDASRLGSRAKEYVRR